MLVFRRVCRWYGLLVGQWIGEAANQELAWMAESDFASILGLGHLANPGADQGLADFPAHIDCDDRELRNFGGPRGNRVSGGDVGRASLPLPIWSRPRPRPSL